MKLVGILSRVAAFLLVLLCLSAGKSNAQFAPKTFLNLTLGMPSTEVFKALGKPATTLDNVPLINNKKILSDTLSLDSCAIKFRRSFGFDASNNLTVLGLTFKGNQQDVEDKKDCVLNWLKRDLGNPQQTEMTDGVMISKWNFQDGTTLSFEAKAYNEKDYFMLMYFYK